MPLHAPQSFADCSQESLTDSSLAANTLVTLRSPPLGSVGPVRASAARQSRIELAKLLFTGAHAYRLPLCSLKGPSLRTLIGLGFALLRSLAVLLHYLERVLNAAGEYHEILSYLLRLLTPLHLQSPSRCAMPHSACGRESGPFSSPLQGGVRVDTAPKDLLRPIGTSSRLLAS